jgi:sigma-E factor negative regulatory protein RseA
MLYRDEDLRQQVSALFDEELDLGQNPDVLEKLEADGDLRSAWGTYSLIGQVIRSPSGALADRGFSERVSGALSAEPTVFAPRGRSKRPGNLREQIISVALAASLVGVVVIMGRSVIENAGMWPGSLVGGQVASNASQASESRESLAEAQFNDYLLSHNETAYMAGSAGMLPYVRLVSYQADR